MTLAVIQANVQTANGTVSVAPGAEVEIRDADLGTLVNLFEDQGGNTSAGNPVTADGDGFFRVYTAPVRVRIKATADSQERTWEDVQLVSVGSSDDQDVPTNATVNAGLNNRVIRVGSIDDLTEAPLDKQQISIASTEDSEGFALLYEWDADSTETAIDPAVVEISGVATGRLILLGYQRTRIGRSGATVIDFTPNMVAGYAGNIVTTEVHSCNICGGGTENNENVIGGLTSSVGDSGTSNIDPTFTEGPDARYCWIGGGYDNVNNGLASGIHGQHCLIEAGADHGVISGGSFHKITDGPYNVIAGGTQNTVDATSGYSTIGGGGGSVIAVGAQYSTIGGGADHNTDSIYSTIAGGSGNTATGQASCVGGGATNDVSQQGGVIAGGEVNTINGSGKRWGTITGGRENTVSAEGAVITGGRGNTVSSDFGQASGRDAVSEKSGQDAFANQSFATAGDAQTSRLIMKATTTDATPTNVTDLNGSSGMPSKVDTAIGYRIRIVAHRTDAQGDNAVIILEGLAHRGGSGSWAIVALADQIAASSGATGWSARIFDDSGTLRVEVTGEASKNIQWVAHIDWTQNTG